MFDLLKKNHGLLLIVASQLFLSVVNIAVKKLNSIDPPVPTLELIIIRMGMTFAFSIAYMLYTNIPHPFLGPEGVRVLLAFRGFAGFFGLFGVYFALQYLSLSDATVLTFLVPLTTALSGAIFLKENFTKKQFVAGTLSLIGVIFIARPVSLFGHASAAEIPHVPSVSTNSTAAVPLPENASEQGTPGDRLIAVGVSLVGVLGSTGAYTAIRAIGKRAHALHSMASFSLQSVIVSVIGMIITRTSPVLPTRLLWLALFIEIGVFGFLAQVLLTMGFQRETAGRGTMAVYTQIVFASIGERIFFHVVPSVLSIIGTLIIISCALYIAVSCLYSLPIKKIISNFIHVFIK
ncbi:drug/metabolite transporter superfamily [Dendrothele bispora CBS 962.96]|uniref:Drug/metabolite transporter superfamily n=1 Tax=Dendrothele bispora (strain CBS 962.96) TaxID=1314807 RepID=A0A4S8L8F8_DENBC|nr:drug/metabolite transporter superfamily [Dendrothele bispora CBS 962.96]